MEVAPILFVVVVVAVGAAIVTHVLNRKRQERIRAYARHRGWTYQPHSREVANRWTSPPFDAGRARQANEVLTGTFHGEQAVSFSYRYVTGNGKNRSTHHFHVVALHLPAALPWLRLNPEGFGSAISKLFGGQDIRFESKAFNDTWRVQGPEGQFPFDFIHPRMMDRLMQPDAVGHNITVEGQDILLYVRGRQEVERIDFYLNLLLGIIQLIPRHLWLRVGHDPLARR
ncbi:hypothetical protein [Sanguibacter sp. Z1732]|uniref:hypothetical protein n=1 Tax=Sanguibacter sp. Z1732 TaxID=3435412 RepID=UPI003D9C7FC3